MQYYFVVSLQLDALSGLIKSPRASGADERSTRESKVTDVLNQQSQVSCVNRYFSCFSFL